MPPERENGTPQGPPNVYHPRSAPPPAYEAYPDPAAAHGWENAYDETAELPRVDDAGTAEGAGARGGRRAGGAGARSGRRAGGAGRGARRKARARGSRRLVITAGVVGAVSAAALIAGLSLSGSSPEGASRGKQSGDGTSPTAGASTDPTGAPHAEPATPRSSGATASPRADAPGTSPSAAATDEDDRTGSAPSATPSTPSATGAAPSTPTATASTVAPGGSGRDDPPGRGPGKTKGPR